MLDIFRKHSQSYFIYFVFGALIVVFAFTFGPGGSGCGGPSGDYAASVDGDIIRRQDFASLLGRYLEQSRRFGLGGNNADAQRVAMRKQAIDQLIERKLLTHAAYDRGLVISDNELRDYLEENFKARRKPADTDSVPVNQLSRKEYTNWVSNNFQTTPTRFEQQLRDDLIADKLKRVLVDQVMVSDEELKVTYSKEHDRAMFTMIKFNIDRASIVEITDEAIQTLLKDEHDAVEKHYKKERFRYSSREQVHARQILKKLARDASDAEVAKARSALMALRNQIEAGADFSSLAKSNSDDTRSKDKGGDLGFVQRGQMGKPLMDALFALVTPNTMVSEPVRTPQGLHLLQMVEKKSPEQKELNEVKQDVAKSLLTLRGQEAAAKQKAQAFLTQLVSGTAMETITFDQEQNSTYQEKQEGESKPLRVDSPWMLKGQEYLPGLGKDPTLKKQLFSLTKENPLLKEPLKNGNSFVVVRLIERELPDLTKFDDEKKTLREQSLNIKRSRVYQNWIGHLRQKAEIIFNPQLFGNS